MSELPNNWASCKLPQVVYFQEGPGLRKFQYRDKGVPFLNIRTLVKDRVNLSLCKFLDEEEVYQKYQHFLLQAGDLVCSTSGTLGKIAEIRASDLPLMLNTSVIRFRALDENIVLQKFIRYYLKSDLFLGQATRASTGSAQVNVGPSHLSEFDIHVPPITEQKRIADKLDAVLARVDACRDRLDRIPAILKRFRQSALAAATSGKLTEDWRVGRGNRIDAWRTGKGAEVFSFITSGSRGWASYYANSGAIFLRIGNLDHETIALDLSEIQYVNPPEGAEGTRTRVQLNDILISITADVGMVGLISESLGDAYINQHICLARPKVEHSPKYLAYFLASPTGGLGRLQDLSRGATKVGLTLGDIRELEIKLPTLDEQTEIVRRVEALFACADRLEARHTAARAQVEKLTPATLAKAFRGELVPQDPNDEPASELLERIKAQRSEPRTDKPSRSRREPG